MDAFLDTLFAILMAFFEFLVDSILTLLSWFLAVIALLLPNWQLPEFASTSSFYVYCQWAAYFIPVNYSLGLWVVYLSFVGAVKVVRGLMSIVQVDV